ncbi:hypothetical protein LMG31886_42650 [Xanthomonas hydrangeae]|nr:hypothetical protein LMG31884_43730 [Xanthomonas hydrangeae]CAD7729603.1 hypothetical protein LMG31884_43730 [Xanthomonas hydrangeae]CAD7732318.1 hypothetical protein LMG31885_17740 [Xanthomonas hydrangeae]CAD7732321.1 hypothetical protein LMG31885_17740 [Xanthomonas hydrangeae]CAD7744958.1 hypothetical protein LMG31887_43650 [Xanthomonas hydrangeae]
MIANGDPGVPRGRKQEIAALLRFISAARVRNTVWLTADVHYCAAHYSHPDKAAFQQFEPFWEFVAGPLNAGCFGPNALDVRFGQTVIFQKTPAPNLSPLAGYQFLSEVEIDGASGVLRARTTLAWRASASIVVIARQLICHDEFQLNYLS